MRVRLPSIACVLRTLPYVVFFFFNDPAPPEIYPLSLPDPLPIYAADTRHVPWLAHDLAALAGRARERSGKIVHRHIGEPARSEEHTSELQSQSNLVCRLLLVKKTISVNYGEPVRPHGNHRRVGRP